MKKTLFCCCLLLFAVSARAQMDWSMVGSAGEIDESSLSLYQYSGARLEFKSGQTGTIIARYPVTNTYGSANSLTPPWDLLRITYIDSSASGSVTAKLIAVDECSGTEEELCSVTGSGGTPGCSFCLFPPDIDFGAFSYYIEATVSRTSTSADPTLIMMSLQH